MGSLPHSDVAIVCRFGRLSMSWYGSWGVVQGMVWGGVRRMVWGGVQNMVGWSTRHARARAKARARPLPSPAVPQGPLALPWGASAHSDVLVASLNCCLGKAMRGEGHACFASADVHASMRLHLLDAQGANGAPLISPFAHCASIWCTSPPAPPSAAVGRAAWRPGPGPSGRIRVGVRVRTALSSHPSSIGVIP